MSIEIWMHPHTYLSQIYNTIIITHAITIYHSVKSGEWKSSLKRVNHVVWNSRHLVSLVDCSEYDSA